MNINKTILIILIYYSNTIFSMENIDENEINIQEQFCIQQLENVRILYHQKAYRQLFEVAKKVYDCSQFPELRYEAALYLAESCRVQESQDLEQAMKYYKELAEQNNDLKKKHLSLYAMSLIYEHTNDQERFLECIMQVDFSLVCNFIIKSAYKRAITMIKMENEKLSEIGKMLFSKVKSRLHIVDAFDLAVKYYEDHLIRYDVSDVIIDLFNICFEQNKFKEIKIKSSFFLGKIYYFGLEDIIDKDIDKARDYFNFTLCQLIKMQKIKTSLNDDFIDLKEHTEYYLGLIQVKEKSIQG